MNLKRKKEQLAALYGAFETECHEFRKDAVCKAGCAFCCTNMGNIDISSLEGLLIREQISIFPQKAKKDIRNRLRRNIKEKEKGQKSACPFLRKNRTCMIYEIRPFSCRQLYSLEICNEKGAVLHRQVREKAVETVKKIQQTDENGYSGHISYILELLDNTEFRKFYESGGFDPSRIMDYGKSRKLVINRMVSASGTGIQK